MDSRSTPISQIAETDVSPPGPWAADAECRDVPDPDIFFPGGQDQSAAQARQLCARCSVREQCLGYALSNNERFGIWGGLDPTERDVLRRRHRQEARRSAA